LLRIEIITHISVSIDFTPSAIFENLGFILVLDEMLITEKRMFYPRNILNFRDIHARLELVDRDPSFHVVIQQIAKN